VGPVTEEEYLSRAERYDKQMKELIGVDPEGKTVAEKIAITRKYRYDQYYKLMDVAYARRGWTKNGVPTLARLEELGIALPEIVNIIKNEPGVMEPECV
jgi:aldehyde:ferredoxin oxidoreductase